MTSPMRRWWSMRWPRVLLVIGITFLAASGTALGLSPDMTDTPIEGTDLTIGHPDGWRLRPKQQSAEEIRAFIAAFSSGASEAGLHASESDAQLVQAWKRMSEDFVHVAFDPRDNDTVTVAVYTGEFWPSLSAWRRLQKSNARRFPGKLLTVDEKGLGAHSAFTSIVRTSKGGLLIATMVIEQPGGRYVVVSATLDGVDRALTEQILASIKAA